MTETTRFWGRSQIEEPTFRYTRRWERWLAVVWPPKRRKLRMMQRLAGMSLSQVHAEYNRALADTLVYGHSTALAPDPDKETR